MPSLPWHLERWRSVVDLDLLQLPLYPHQRHHNFQFRLLSFFQRSTLTAEAHGNRHTDLHPSMHRATMEAKTSRPILYFDPGAPRFRGQVSIAWCMATAVINQPPNLPRILLNRHGHWVLRLSSSQLHDRAAKQSCFQLVWIRVEHLVDDCVSDRARLESKSDLHYHCIR